MSFPTKQEPRGPYVEFEDRAVEDRAETVKQGTLVMKSVDYAILRALGSKDTVEKPALEWLEYIRAQAARGEYPGAWAKFYREQYDAWKDGGDVSKVNGLHVRNWPAISRAQAEALIAVKLLTVEDLAQAPEDVLQRIGMGARELQSRARAWVDARSDGQTAEELALLREQNVNLKAQVEDLTAKVSDLSAKVSAAPAGDSPSRPRRRREVEEE